MAEHTLFYLPAKVNEMSCIWPRKNTYWISYTINGKRIQRSLKVKDRKLAEFKQKQIDIELEQGRVQAPSNKSIEEFKQEYEAYAKTRKSIKYFKIERYCLKQFFTATQIRTLKDITTAVCNNFIQAQITAGKKSRTVNHYIKYISNFCNYAIDQGYIFENPTRRVKRLKEERNPVRFLSDEEIKILLEKAKGSHLYPMIATALYTGCRVSELISLEWPAFDWSNKTLTIRNKEGYQTKNRGFRVIPLSDRLIAILEPYKQVSGHCFPTSRGKAFAKRPINELRNITKAAGIKDCGWHTFRKTFCSHLIMKGVSITKVAKWAGHSDPRITYQTYSHLAPKADDEIEKLEF